MLAKTFSGNEKKKNLTEAGLCCVDTRFSNECRVGNAFKLPMKSHKGGFTVRQLWKIVIEPSHESPPPLEFLDLFTRVC